MDPVKRSFDPSVSNVDEIPSPALLVYPERVEENIGRMIALAGGVDRLRPHIKTHKLAEVVRMQLARGINRFKCATIAEAELAASAGAPDVLLAYQPVGPNIRRLAELARRFPSTRFGAVVDDRAIIELLAKAFSQSKLAVFLDIDCGMHRTGIEPGQQAVELYRIIAQATGLIPAGLHAYDGHLHEKDLAVRKQRSDEAFAPVAELRRRLEGLNLRVPTIVAGGTPTFPMHAQRPGVECSPGTCLFWDAGYTSKVPDLDFLCAAWVLTRVISKPGVNRLCLDLGHKAIASENPHPRMIFPELPDAKAITHSEEHLVIETAEANRFSVGQALYGIPWHICPTVALHSEAVVVAQGRADTRWKILARERRLSI